MTASDHQLAQREHRARLLAAAPDWRASDARVDPRVAIGSIVAMWLLYFLITTGLAMLAGTPEQWAFTGRRGIVVVARSEEHTSELQSLMRITSSVFCLKK